jgi:hypothetical protein
MFDRNKHKKDNEIYNKYIKLVNNFFYLKTKDKYVTEELSAVTMSKILLNYDKNFNEKTIDNYVYRITNNCFYDYLRKQKQKSNINFDYRETLPTIFESMNIDYNQILKNIDKLLINNTKKIKLFYNEKYINNIDNKTLIEKYNFSLKKINYYDKKIGDIIEKNIDKILFM